MGTGNANHGFHRKQSRVKTLTFGQAFRKSWMDSEHEKIDRVFGRGRGHTVPPWVFGAPKSLVGIGLRDDQVSDQHQLSCVKWQAWIFRQKWYTTVRKRLGGYLLTLDAFWSDEDLICGTLLTLPGLSQEAKGNWNGHSGRWLRVLWSKTLCHACWIFFPLLRSLLMGGANWPCSGGSNTFLAVSPVERPAAGLSEETHSAWRLVLTSPSNFRNFTAGLCHATFHRTPKVVIVAVKVSRSNRPVCWSLDDSVRRPSTTWSTSMWIARVGLIFLSLVLPWQLKTRASQKKMDVFCRQERTKDRVGRHNYGRVSGLEHV